jgi:hypothetical protein
MNRKCSLGSFCGPEAKLYETKKMKHCMHVQEGKCANVDPLNRRGMCVCLQIDWHYIYIFASIFTDLHYV